HGLNIGGGLPYYVIKKDVKKNTIFVTTKLNNTNLWRSKIILNDIHWIDSPPKLKKIYQVKLRYRGPSINCTISKNIIYLKDEAKAIASGQSAVVYDEELVIGGGIIE
ncbi:MAG TPA: aminomethyltransferase beta-barrel domain-containing protein, partial [Patescibacteria group bacterium]|nr:aminomethyltransferase beta-barrel domain-containing protein [Patescibacteria group bacterium]